MSTFGNTGTIFQQAKSQLKLSGLLILDGVHVLWFIPVPQPGPFDSFVDPT